MKAKCNQVVKPSGTNSTRMNPNAFARNNLSKGGVNKTIVAGKSSSGTAKRK